MPVLSLRGKLSTVLGRQEGCRFQMGGKWEIKSLRPCKVCASFQDMYPDHLKCFGHSNELHLARQHSRASIFGEAAAYSQLPAPS
jgi:hypothetical protein